MAQLKDYSRNEHFLLSVTSEEAFGGKKKVIHKCGNAEATILTDLLLKILCQDLKAIRALKKWVIPGA